MSTATGGQAGSGLGWGGIARLGLVPGKPLRILERGEGVRVEVEGEVYLLPRALAQAVGVEPLG